MRSLYLFFGQRRCGNHGMIEWVASQIVHKYGQGSLAFFNNKQPGKIGPKTRKSIARCGAIGLKRVIFSYEDILIDGVDFDNIIPKQVKLVGRFDRVYHILLLRDPFNLFASRLKHPNLARKFRLNPLPTVDLWKMYAREYLGETNYLPNKVCMNFNEWFSSRKYRKTLCKQLGITFSDTGLNKVHDEGDGSSFDGMKYRNRAQKMKVLERWRVFVEDKDYIRIMKTPGLIELSEKIFGTMGMSNIGE